MDEVRAQRDSVSLFLCGDVMTGRGIDQVLPHPGDPQIFEAHMRDARDYAALAERRNGPTDPPIGFTEIWGPAPAFLDRWGPDVRIINLETAITESGRPAPKGINYRMHPHNVPVLAALGVDGCVLANNHILDWGMSGLHETLSTLNRHGMPYAGAGENAAKAAAPAILPLAGGRRLLLFAWGAEDSGIPRQWAANADHPGVNLLADVAKTGAGSAAAIVATVRQPGDIVVVSVHWGGNWGYAIPPAHRAFAHRLIDLEAADIVHGHSSHHPKGLEVYKGRPILYGCGDFLNDYEGIGGYEAYRDDLVLMYLVRLGSDDCRLESLEMAPLKIRRCRLTAPEPREIDWLAERLNRACRGLGTAVTRADDRLVLHAA